MNIQRIIIVLLIILFSSITHAITAHPYKVGVTHTIHSKILNSNRHITTYLPENYHQSTQNYPVVYILDGQKFFLHAVSLAQLFSQHQKTPDFIVVGINTQYPQRFGHYDKNGAPHFLKFIQNEVILLIEQHYRVNDERILFGWEYAGGFGIEVLTKVNDLFSSIITASPFPINPEDGAKSNRLSMVHQWLSQNNQPKAHFFFTAGLHEESVKTGTDDLKRLLDQQAENHLKWDYHILTDEDHLSTPFSTLYHGLRAYYFNYPQLQFDNLQQFYQSGGMNFIRNYQQSRAKRFGLDPALSSWTKFTLIRNAIRAGHFQQFQSFIHEFADESFYKQLKTGRLYEIAKFYHHHQKTKQAIHLYRLILEKSPQHSEALIAIENLQNTIDQDNKK